MSVMNRILKPTKAQLPRAERVLPERDTEMAIPARHAVLGTPLRSPYPTGSQIAEFAMGCFWGAERLFWRINGVLSTAVGYAGGLGANPTYAKVCSGRTGHVETVRVVFDPTRVSYARLLKAFWEGHDPTAGMRQGADVGSQYRSAIFTHGPEQAVAAATSRELYEQRLAVAGYGSITTQIVPAGPFYFAEAYHQQYLERNPNGYCGLEGTGVSCPIGVMPVATS